MNHSVSTMYQDQAGKVQANQQEMMEHKGQRDDILNKITSTTNKHIAVHACPGITITLQTEEVISPSTYQQQMGRVQAADTQLREGENSFN